MAITEAGLGRSGATNEGFRQPLSEGQRASLRIIQAALPSLTVRNDAPLSNIPFDVLSKMPRFPEIYRDTENMALFGSDDRDLNEAVKGAVFHQLGYASVVHSRDNRGIILPEPVVFRVASVLNPGSQPVPHPFSPGLEGVYVPDSLEVAVNGGRIGVTGFVEYSTVQSIDKFVEQIRASKILAEKLGPLVDDPEFVVVVPRGSNILVPRMVAGTRVRKVESEFSYGDVNETIRMMTQDYRRDGDPDVASISDMVQERIKREERIRKIGEPALYQMRQQAAMLVELQRDVPEDVAA